jgi:predicted phage terminase large subunit-like protein
MFLLDVYRHKVDFPSLKRAVRDLAVLHRPDVVLVEDKASGISLIQELRADNFSMVQAAPAIDGDKIMRLHAQTAKIEGGFVLFPKEAHWLDAYLLELVTFPNSKNDDQVDSTVFALAWSTLHAAVPAIIQFYANELAKIEGKAADQKRMKRVWVPLPSSTWILITGRQVAIPPDRIIEVTEEEMGAIILNGGKRVD